jgi:hypothetical protein
MGLMGVVSEGSSLPKFADALEGYIPLFRGTGKRGFSGLKSTEGGVYGDGIYFYTDPLPARSHSTWPGGGVITGYAKPEDLILKGNIAVLKDVNKFLPAGKISLHDTSLPPIEFVKRAEKALSEFTPIVGMMGLSSLYSPEAAQAKQHQDMASQQALEEPTFDPTTLLAGPARWGGGLMNMIGDMVLRYLTK